MASTQNSVQIINALVFSIDNPRHFVTVGKGHVRNWFIEEERNCRHVIRNSTPDGQISKKLINNAVFINANDYLVSHGNFISKITAALQSSSNNNKNSQQQQQQQQQSSKSRVKFSMKSLDKGMGDVKNFTSFASDRKRNLIFCGAENGTIQVVDLNLKPATISGYLPKPHRIDDLLMEKHQPSVSVDGHCYPDVLALAFVDDNLLVACYSDHSMYIWKVDAVFSKAQVFYKQFFHPCRIFDADVYPNCNSPIYQDDTFATSSNDGTIRIWSFQNQRMVSPTSLLGFFF